MTDSTCETCVTNFTVNNNGDNSSGPSGTIRATTFVTNNYTSAVGPTGAIQLSGGTNTSYDPLFLYVPQAFPMPGTLSVSSGNTVVTGVQTNFLWLVPGEQLLITGYGAVTILSIQGNTSLTLSAPVSQNVVSAGFSATRNVLQIGGPFSFPGQAPSTPGTMVLAGYMGPFLANGSPYYLPAYQLN